MRDSIGKYPAGIDPAFIHLTGTIVTWWGRAEGILIRDLITLRQLPTSAAIAAKELFPVQTGRVINQWLRLQRLYYADDAQRLEKLATLETDLIDAAEDRNVLVHYFWPYGAEKGQDTLTLQSIKPQKGNNSVLEIKQVEITVEKLDDLNNRVARIYHVVMADSFNLSVRVNRERRERGAKGEKD